MVRAALKAIRSVIYVIALVLILLFTGTAKANDLRSTTVVDPYCVQAISCKKLGIYAYSTTGQVISRVCVQGKCQRGRAGWFTSSFRFGKAFRVGQRVKVKINLRSVRTGQRSSETVIAPVRRVNQ